MKVGITFKKSSSFIYSEKFATPSFTYMKLQIIDPKIIIKRFHLDWLLRIYYDKNIKVCNGIIK